jgi:hypothetical protein
LLKPDDGKAVHEEVRRMLRIVASEQGEQESPLLAIGDGALGFWVHSAKCSQTVASNVVGCIMPMSA